MSDDAHPTAAVAPRAGERVGHYQIVGELGRGGMGIVYRARDLVLGRSVALKCATPIAVSDRRQRRRILQEARAASRLSHPHIVPIFEVFEHEGVTWLAMEHIEGTTLRALLASEEPLPLMDVLNFSEGLASALQAAHRRNVLHRDVNPNNVMVTTDGRVVLTDFGLARIQRISEDSSTQSRRSNDGKVMGTPRYMSPEQALGKPVDERTDIFSLGTVIYEMSTGRRAFDATGPEVLDSLLHRTPPSMRRLNYEVPDELERIARKALAKDPGERYQNVTDLLVDLRALRRIVGGASAPPAEADAPAGRRMRRAQVGALVALGISAVGLAALWWWRRPAPEMNLVPSRVRVGVLMPRFEAGDSKAAEWPPLIQALAVAELARNEEIAVIDPSSVNAALGRPGGTPAPGDATNAALRTLGATLVIDSMISRARGGHLLHANLVDPSTGEVRFSSEAVIANEERLGPEVAALTAKMHGFLQLRVRPPSSEKDVRPYIAHRPKNVEALKAFLQGVEYTLRYEPGASKYVRRALELDPDFIPPRILLISALVQAGKLEEARAHHEYLLRLEAEASPLDQALIGWAGAFVAGDKPDQARHLQVALEYSPGNNILLVTLGELRLRMGDVEGALAALSEPIRLRWRYPALYSLYAACLIASDRHQEAERILEGALEISPVVPDTYGMLAALTLKDGQEDEAQRYADLYTLRQKERGADAAAVSAGLAGHFASVGLFDAAARKLKEAVRADSSRLVYRQRLADALYKAERPDEAVAEYSRVLEMDARSADAHLMLGRIKEAKSLYSEALSHYEAFLVDDPSNSAAADIRERVEVLRGRTSSLGRR